MFAADHDVADLAVSATPPTETRRRAAELATGVHDGTTVASPASWLTRPDSASASEARTIILVGMQP